MNMRRCLPILFAVLLLGNAPEPALTADEQAWLAGHNAERVRLNIAPLVWDEALADDAAHWARELAQRRVFEHSPPDLHGDQGENLWMGSSGSWSATSMVELWLDERARFQPGIFPDVDRHGDWREVGHYTQIIWRGTHSLGCAKAAGMDDNDYMVCRYAPAGNVIGTRIP